MPRYLIHITLEEIVKDGGIMAGSSITLEHSDSPYRKKLKTGEHAEQIAEEAYGFSAPKQHLALHIFSKIDDRILATIPLRWRRAR